MKENSLRKLRSVYGICLSALTAVVGVLFVVQIWSIFLSAEPGQEPYTVEVVAEKFWQISIPVFLWVLALIGGGVIAYLFPEEKKKEKGTVSAKITLERLQRRMKNGGMDIPESQKQEDLRFIVNCVTALVCAACGILCGMILFGVGPLIPLGGEFFSSHQEAVRLVSAMPWILMALGCVIGASYFFEYSYKRQTQALKAEFATNRSETMAEKKTWTDWLCEKLPFLKSPKLLLGVRIGLGVVGIVFVVVGILNGGMADVLTKAINICTQCIGLG